MGVRVITDATESMSALYDSVTDTAFGPIFHEPETADDFLAWYGPLYTADPRVLPPQTLLTRVAEWRKSVADDQLEIPF